MAPMACRSCDFTAPMKFVTASRGAGAPVSEEPIDGFLLQAIATIANRHHFFTDGSEPV